MTEQSQQTAKWQTANAEGNASGLVQPCQTCHLMESERQGTIQLKTQHCPFSPSVTDRWVFLVAAAAKDVNDGLNIAFENLRKFCGQNICVVTFQTRGWEICSTFLVYERGTASCLLLVLVFIPLSCLIDH